ncbi:hypothetical protein [Dyadobacter frigoris]|uniref:Uncharacterized protein n=1 Tax=Dyadobacter frigoris TaxID=2576211 RepID=A0A4U6DB10_9BACT|nr:hypothetical protein [Dyadobacter frigoris]TKT93517.1 hypothetical protein FDK13_06645 [Dyadobacter frigoris]GLU55750.1 hypothetical protein Dfri01_52110 [Dyadobacter frigoris]
MALKNETSLRKESNDWKRRVADKKVFWKTVKKVQVDGIERLVIPFNLKEEFTAKLPDSSKISYSNASYIIATKTNSGYNFEVMTKLPDIEYLTATKFERYSGLLIFESLVGEFIRGYKVTRDNKVTEITLSEGDSKSRITTEMCTYVDWYSCTNQVCSYMHTDVVCEGGQVPTFDFGTNTGYGTIGEDISSGIGSLPPAGGEGGTPLPYVGKLCPPTNWTTTGAAKSSNVTGLGLTAINFSTEQIINVDFFTSCVTIPTHGRTNEQIGIMFAYAYNNARQRIEIALNNGTIEYQHNQIRARLISYITEGLRSFDQGASFVPSGGCQNTVTNTGNYYCLNSTRNKREEQMNLFGNYFLG